MQPRRRGQTLGELHQAVSGGARVVKLHGLGRPFVTWWWRRQERVRERPLVNPPSFDREKRERAEISEEARGNGRSTRTSGRPARATTHAHGLSPIPRVVFVAKSDALTRRHFATRRSFP